jgi:hypothetical protein
VNVSKKLFLIFAAALLATAVSGCNTTDNANANVNANTTVASDSTRPGPDNSDITTSVDANGVRTETRVFRNNPRVSKVVVTTSGDGRRTVRVYSPKGEEKVVDDIGDALNATGDAIAKSAGWVVDKTAEGVNEAGDKLEDVGDQTAKGAKKVGKATVEGAKTVGEKTAEGAKKTGRAIKKAVTP